MTHQKKNEIIEYWGKNLLIFTQKLKENDGNLSKSDKLRHCRDFLKSFNGVMFDLLSKEKEQEIREMIKELKAKAHEVDGEAFGYELLEEKQRCCPGDDATAIYEITLDKVLQKLTPSDRE